MDSGREVSNQEKDNLANDVMESLGENEVSDGLRNEPDETDSRGSNQDPLYVQKRLKQQKRAHERELRGMQSRIDELQSRFENSQPQQHYGYADTSNVPTPPMGNMDDHISRAVSLALQQKDMEERKAREAASQAHVQRKYADLHKHLDNVADKYDDFDDVVRGEYAPYTPSMRDAALILPQTGPGSAGEVLYKLGKNPDELNRISRLHPSDQAAEMIRLSHALISDGTGQKTGQPSPLGGIKNNPVVNSPGVNEKTSPSEIRARMKAGKFK